VNIVIVSHGHYRFLDPCLLSIYQNTRAVRFEVTLVDNVGEPEIRDLIEKKFPQVMLRVNEHRQGFAENNNSVIRDSTARYSFLLNPDTVTQPSAIDRLVEYMDWHPDVGLSGPKLLYPDGRLQLSCRHFPTLSTVLFRRTPLRILFGTSSVLQRYYMEDWDHETCRSVEWLFGAAILARREAIEQVGLLDARFFMYCEDIDWCLRFLQAGWDIHYVSDAVIIHHLDDDKYNQYFSKHRLQHYRTMLRFFLKHPGCFLGRHRSLKTTK